MEFGKGSSVTIGTVAVTSPVSIKLPKKVYAMVDTTNLATTGSAQTSKVAPLAKVEPCEIKAIYDPANFAALKAIEGDDTKAFSSVIHGATTSATVAATACCLVSVEVEVTGPNEKDMMSLTVDFCGDVTVS